jgi:hypothetical protein
MRCRLTSRFLSKSSAAVTTFNPFAEAVTSDIELMLRAMCSPGLSPSETEELEDQIEALVPAVVELRDQGHLALNARVLSDMARLEGFMSLAVDERLTNLSRCRCAAIRDRMIARGVQSILGHTSR